MGMGGVLAPMPSVQDAPTGLRGTSEEFVGLGDLRGHLVARSAPPRAELARLREQAADFLKQVFWEAGFHQNRVGARSLGDLHVARPANARHRDDGNAAG